MAGIGANTALRDADELRHALVEQPVSAAVACYEHAMRGYANQALALDPQRDQRSPRVSVQPIDVPHAWPTADRKK